MVGRLGRRKFLFYGSAALGTSLLLKACGDTEEAIEGTEENEGSEASTPAGDGETIKVGILHSLSGTKRTGYNFLCKIDSGPGFPWLLNEGSQSHLRLFSLLQVVYHIPNHYTASYIHWIKVSL